MHPCYNTHMPSKRNTHGLDVCTTYTLRVCGDNPCEYHCAVDESKKRGITLQALINYRMQATNRSNDNDERRDEKIESD